MLCGFLPFKYKSEVLALVPGRPWLSNYVRSFSKLWALRYLARHSWMLTALESSWSSCVCVTASTQRRSLWKPEHQILLHLRATKLCPTDLHSGERCVHLIKRQSVDENYLYVFQTRNLKPLQSKWKFSFDSLLKVCIFDQGISKQYSRLCDKHLTPEVCLFPFQKLKEKSHFELHPNWPFSRNLLLWRAVEKFPLGFSHGKEFSP